MKFRLTLVLFVALSSASIAQEQRLIALSPSIGDTLDAKERSWYMLLPDIAGFEKAVVYLNADSSLQAKVYALRGTVRSDTVIQLHRTMISLRNQIAQIEKVRGAMPPEFIVEKDMFSTDITHAETVVEKKSPLKWFITVEAGLWKPNRSGQSLIDLHTGIGFGVDVPLNSTELNPGSLHLRPRIGHGQSAASNNNAPILFAEALLLYTPTSVFSFLIGPAYKYVVGDLNYPGNYGPFFNPESSLSYLYATFGMDFGLSRHTFLQLRFETALGKTFHDSGMSDGSWSYRYPPDWEWHSSHSILTFLFGFIL